MSISITRDLPGIDLHEEAEITQLSILPEFLLANYKVTASRAGLEIGVRYVNNPPGASPGPGYPITSLPQEIQDAINLIEDFLLTQPYIFDAPPPPAPAPDPPGP
jgi:hypothetical protein